MQWFNNPNQALINQGYTTTGSIKYTPADQFWKPSALHAFSRLVDNFIDQWGVKTTIPSRSVKAKKDILITVPGMIIFPQGSKPQEQAGVFTYIIDSANGQWYHPMFTPESGQKLITDLLEKGYFSPEMKGYYDVAFPPLKKVP